ncbi:hypothetical protein SO802_025292 [Lithocarpus litseifolius]|uniref:RNase H type-1 domain-containing protein n=1 Tax=Lithocarpus litseifolius TaxID=425828 RepID=A0AAW2BY99_9ROSI
MIHINIYYGGPLSNADTYDEFPFQGPGIQCYYMMIRHKLKTLNELKEKIMEELQLNLALHDIHITFRSPYEVLNQCIHYRHMAIKEDKHVKIMFNKMQKWEQCANFELYVTLEPCAEIVQTTTFLQFAALDDWCTTLGGYTPPFQESPTTIESEPGNRYEDQFCAHRGESSTFPVVEDEDEDYVDHVAINGEDLDDRDVLRFVQVGYFICFLFKVESLTTKDSLRYRPASKKPAGAEPIRLLHKPTVGVRRGELNSVGVGVMVRDWNGQFLAAMSRKIHAPLGPPTAEAKAFELGLQFAKQLGITDFILEGDLLIVSRALNHSSSVPVSIDAVIMGIGKANSLEFLNVDFSHVK